MRPSDNWRTGCERWKDVLISFGVVMAAIAVAWPLAVMIPSVRQRGVGVVFVLALAALGFLRERKTGSEFAAFMLTPVFAVDAWRRLGFPVAVAVVSAPFIGFGLSRLIRRHADRQET